jgi:hypothetical protein
MEIVLTALELSITPMKISSGTDQTHTEQKATIGRICMSFVGLVYLMGLILWQKFSE